eukprot:m.35389 g.35389  ORF g.35389 m.35389 type:complete len:596 (+) comp32106_c0_seq1:32-1819(+)
MMSLRFLRCISRRSSFSSLSISPSLQLRNLCTVSSRSIDYEKERKEFRLDAPRLFNFSSVVERWVAVEKATGRSKERNPALWWVNDAGDEVKWSFGELLERSKKTANLLTQVCKLKRGDTVILAMERVPEWWLINLACIRSGIVVSPASTQLTSEDLLYRLEASKAAGIISDGVMAKKVDEIPDGSCRDLRVKLLIHSNAVADRRRGWTPYADLIDQASGEHEACETLSSEQMNVFFTSGTTGLPKMAVHTHGSYGLGHVITGQYWLALTEKDVFWNMSDTGWAKAYWSSLFAPWTQGSTVFSHHSARFNPERTLEILNTYPITTFCAAPTAYRIFVQKDISRFRFPSLQQTVSAGEPLNAAVIEKWMAETGHLIREGYGQTETTLLCGTLPGMKPRYGSMGKPAPGYDVKIVDSQGNVLPANTEGEIGICLHPDRPVGLFAGYQNDQERTDSSFAGDYYLTGDRGYYDDDGYFWFVSRSDDVIITAGYRVGPFEVESALIEHDSVAESAVVASPDEERGSVIKAFVVLADEYEASEQLADDLRRHVKSVTAPFRCPRKIEFVPSLPKTVSGKIRRIELRDEELRRFRAAGNGGN